MKTFIISYECRSIFIDEVSGSNRLGPWHKVTTNASAPTEIEAQKDARIYLEEYYQVGRLLRCHEASPARVHRSL